MAATSASVSPATTVLSAVVGPTRSPSPRRAKVMSYMSGLNSFGGLKATNHVAALGLPVCTDRSFAEIVGSLKNKKRGGGALSSTCNAAISEIFKIAAIMPDLVLVGVAVSFVLLRIEATVLAITEGLHDVHSLGKEATILHSSLMEELSKANAVLIPLESLLAKDSAAIAREKETKSEIALIHGHCMFPSYHKRVNEALRVFKPLVPSLMFPSRVFTHC